MNYELAKELKDAGLPQARSYTSLKKCTDCGWDFVGGHEAFRCRDCQKLARKKMEEEWQRRWYFANRDKTLAQGAFYTAFKREWDEEFKGKENAKWHKRMARLMGNGGEHTHDEWTALLERTGNQCLKCFRKPPEVKLSKDHIIPLSKGGTNDISNIQPLCVSCNSAKKDTVWKPD